MNLREKISNLSKQQYALIAVFLFIVICRFISAYVHKSLYVDEIDILNHIESLIATGCDADSNRLPLFIIVGTGYGTFTYFYPLAILLKIVGFGALSAKFIQQILTIGACLLVSFSMKKWVSEKNSEIMFWITLFVSLTIPWGFLQTNMIWDPAFVPIYFALHFFFFTQLMKGENLTSFKRYLYAGLSFSLLVLLATVYPVCRIPAVVMWVFCLVWAYKENKINYGQIALIIFLSTIAAIPLAVNLLSPDFNQRATELFIFKGKSIRSEVHLFLENICSLISPGFLFVLGDHVIRHSLPVFGVLGTLSVIPLFSLRNEKLTPLFKYLIVIIATTILATAVTNENPHALRSCLCWMPFSILLSFGWFNFLSDRAKKSQYKWYVVMALFFMAYFAAYVFFAG